MAKTIDRFTCRRDVFNDGFCLMVLYETDQDLIHQLCEELNADPDSQDVIFDKTSFTGTAYLLYLGAHQTAAKVLAKHLAAFVRKVDAFEKKANENRLPNLFRPSRLSLEGILGPGVLANIQVLMHS